MSNTINQDNFKDSLVAFIDILGFDSRARNIGKGEKFTDIKNLLEAVKRTTDKISQSDGLLNAYNLTAISDSVIITVPFNDPACTYGMLMILHDIQYGLLAIFKTLIRGYITRGSVYHKDGFLFGMGYSEAYRGESSYIGGAPRIVLDPEVVSNAKKVVDSQTSLEGIMTVFDYLREDNDGFHFVDFLKPIGTQLSLTRDQLIDDRKTIKTLVDDAIIENISKPTIWSKYKWLENYLKLSNRELELASS